MQRGGFAGDAEAGAVLLHKAYGRVAQGDGAQGGEARVLQGVRTGGEFQHGRHAAVAWRIALYAPHQRIQYRLFDEGVVVDEKEVIACGRFQSGIVAAGKAVVDVSHHFDGGKGDGGVRCGIS